MRCKRCNGALSDNLVVEWPCHTKEKNNLKTNRCIMSWQCVDCHSCFEYDENDEVIRFSSNNDELCIFSCKEHNHHELIYEDEFSSNMRFGTPFMTIEDYLEVIFHDPTSN